MQVFIFECVDCTFQVLVSVLLFMLGRGLTKFNQTIEFETAPGDGVPDNGRRRVIITAVAPHAPESSHFFHFIYNLLELPVDQAFHAFKADFKAIAYATG